MSAEPLNVTIGGEAAGRRRRRGRPPRLLAASSLVIGGALHVLLGATIAVSGLIMPAWAVGVLAIAWAVGTASIVRWRRRPPLVVAVAVSLWIVWLGLASVGDAWLGWTA